MKLVLWRHGQTAWNAQRRFQGHSDVPLDEVGHEQARDAARYLAAMHPDAIFSSDLVRATETASYLAQLTGLPVQLDKDLRERGGGAWEGLTDAEIRSGYPEAYATFIPPDGERTEAVAERAAAALTRIADGLDGTLAVSASTILMEGDSFQAITFASAVGTFAEYNMPDLGAGLFLDVVLGDDGLTLVVRRHD